MSYSSVANYLYSTWFDASNSIPNGTYGNVSLLTFGNAEVGGLTVKNLGVACNHSSTYTLDVSGNASIRSDLDISGNLVLSQTSKIFSSWLDLSLNAKANDDVVVKKSGDQTIDGSKTLTGILNTNQDIIITNNTTKQFKVRNSADTENSSITYSGVRTTGYFWGQAIGGNAYRGTKTGEINFYLTNDELSYVEGVTSNIQTQLNGKQATGTAVLLTDNQTIAGVKTFSNNAVFSGNVSITGNVMSSWIDSSLNTRALDSDVVHLSGNETVSGQKTFTGDVSFNTGVVTFANGFIFQSGSGTADLNGRTLGNPGAIRMSGGSIQTSGGIFFPNTTLRRKLMLAPSGLGSNDFQQFSIGTVGVDTSGNGSLAFNVASSTADFTFNYGTSSTTNSAIATLKSDVSEFNSDLSCNAVLKAGTIQSEWLDASLNTRALDSVVVKTSGTQSISGQKTFNSGIVTTGITLNGNLVSANTLRLGTAAFQVSGAVHFPATDLYRKIILYPVTSNEYQNYSIGANDTNLEQVYMVPDNTRSHKFCYGTSTTTKSDIAILKSDVSIINSDLSCNAVLKAGTIQSSWLDASLNARALDSDVVKLTGLQNISGNKIFGNNVIVRGATDTFYCQNGVYNSSQTLTFPLIQYFAFSITTAITVTLPTITKDQLGATITFRRVGGTTTQVLSCAASGGQTIYGTGITASTAVCGSGVYTATLVALPTGTNDFDWYRIA